MNAENKSNLSFSTRMGYGVGSIGQGLAYNFFFVYFVFFMTDIVGIAPAIAGTISMIGVVWDAITDPMVGSLSDRSKNPKGRRRPFMIKACIPLGLITFLLFTNWPGMSDAVMVAYFVVCSILYWLAYTFTDIPYMTLGAEITDTVEDRLSIRNFGTIFYYVGFLIVSSGTLGIVSWLENNITDGNSIKSWSYLGIIFGIIVSVSYLVSIIATKGKERTQTQSDIDNKPKVNIFKAVVLAFKVKPYKSMVGYILIYNFGCMVLTCALPYVMVWYMGFSEAEIAFVFLVYVLMIFVLSPIAAKIAQIIGNKKFLICALLFNAIVCIMFMFVPFNGVTIYINFFAVAVGIVGWSVCSYAMLYDVAEVSPLKLKINIGGMIVAIYQFFFKFAGAMSTWAVGWLLTAFQYDALAPEQSDLALTGIRAMSTLIPGILFLLAVPIIIVYSLTPEVMDHFRNLMARYQRGESISEDEYKGRL